MRISDWSSDVCSSDLAGLSVDWAEHSAARLPGNAEIALFRIAQEGINNILKHARASHVRLELVVSDDRASLRVEDNGGGFALEQQIGRASCRERVCQYVENSVVAGSLKKKKSK